MNNFPKLFQKFAIYSTFKVRGKKELKKQETLIFIFVFNIQDSLLFKEKKNNWETEHVLKLNSHCLWLPSNNFFFSNRQSIL